MTEFLKLNYIFCTLTVIFTFSDVSSKTRNHHASGNSGQPLILTPMIEAGDIKSAQNLCKVKPLKGNIMSYAGFFTVNATYNSNMFFWFFPASIDDSTAPVIAWLMGGPGDSSLISLFLENGPYKINENLLLELRGPSLTKNHSVIYIDNPIGTGFSFTEDDKGYSTDEVEIGSNLYSVLVQFFTLFPNYLSNDFFVAGESYAGKFITAVSYAIHINNPSAEVEINLKGIAIGNGVIDPITLVNHGDYFHQIGLVDSDGKEMIDNKEQEFVDLVQNERWIKAFIVFDRTLLGYFSDTTLFHNLTGYSFIFNYLYTYDYRDFDIVSRFFAQSDYRKNIHVGNATFNNTSYTATEYLLEDFPQSVKPWFEELLDNYKVLLFNGQLDLLIPYPVTKEFVATLNWSGAAEFQAAPRTQWYVGKDLAGYSKEGGNLNLVLVRNAGHSAPLDQPDWTLDMITRFTRNERFFLNNILV